MNHDDLFDILPTGIIYHDNIGVITHVNPAAEKIIGRKKEELIGRSPLDGRWKFYNWEGQLISNDRHPAIVALQTLKPVHNIRLGFNPVYKDGINWLRISAVPKFKANSKKPYRVIVYFTDQTVEINAWAQVNRAETKSDTLLEAIEHGICHTDSNGKVIRVNDALCRILGLDKTDFAGKLFSDVISSFVTGEKKSAMVTHFNNSIAAHDVSNTHLELNKKNLEVSLYPNPVDNLITIIVRDESERMIRQQAQIAEERNRFFEVIEAANLATWEWNVETGVSVFNERWAEIVGYALGEIAPATMDKMREFIHPNDVELVNQNVMDHLSGSTREIRFETRLRHKKGHWVHVLNVGRIVQRTAEGKPLIMRGIDQEITARINLENQLRVSEKKFRKLFEDHPAIKFVVNSKTEQITDANKSACEFYGYSLAEITQLNIRDLDPTLFIESPQLVEEIRQQKVRRFEARHRLKNGEFRDVEVYTNNMRVNGEWISHSVVTDISDRKKHEQRIRLLNQAIENSPVSLMITNDQGEIEYTNPAFTGIFGYSEEEVRGKSPAILKSGKYDEQFYANLWATIKSGKHWQGEIENRRSDGSVVWLYETIVPVYDHGNEVKHFVSLQADITRRKKAEEQIHYYSNMQQLISKIATKYINTPVDQIDSAIARALKEMGEFVNADRVYVFDYNFERNLATKTNEWSENGMEPDSHSLGSVAMDEMTSWRDAHIKGSTIYINDASLLEEGALRRVLEKNQVKSLIAVPMMNQDECIGFVGYDSVTEIREYTETEQSLLEIFAQILVNIRLRKQAEAERFKLESQFHQSQKMETVGLLAGGIAHDFNNLLTVILGYGDILEDSTGEKSMLAAVHEIKMAGKRAQRLTSQLLAYSRKQLIQPVNLDINQVITDSYKMLHRLLGENIRIQLELDSENPCARADRGQIDQILLNLAVNSRDAMPTGGTLRIATRSISVDHNHPHLKPGEYVVLSVRDSGIGMDDELQQKIFDPFFTTKSREKGSGLGLSTVYGMVNQNGGHIEVESEPNAGSEFHIYLPLLECHPKTINPEPDEPEILKGSETILFVEDEPVLMNLAQVNLSRYGYRVYTASDGLQGIEVFKKYMDEIDLLVTDVIMPGMGGPEMIKKISEIQPDVKVLYCSGYTDHALVHHGELAEGLELIQKPYTAQELLLRIRKIIDSEKIVSENLHK